MIVHCILFARYAEVTGVDRVELDLPDGSVVSDAIDRMRAQIPNGNLIPPRTLVARNRRHVLGGEVLSDGDELALLPPLAGG
ncbi:MAG: MoaD/ThiS family protein [Gemmatimonadales bacterium]